MALLSQSGYLGGAPARLQATLDLDGIVGLKVDDTIQPVALVANGLEAGASPGKNRRWAFTIGTGVMATGTCLIVQAQVAILVDVCAVTPDTTVGASTVQPGSYAPGEALPGGLVPANAAGRFVDRGRGDRPPLLYATGAAAIGGAQEVAAEYLLAGSKTDLLNHETVHLLPLASLVVRPVLALGFISVSLRGRLA